MKKLNGDVDKLLEESYFWEQIFMISNKYDKSYRFIRNSKDNTIENNWKSIDSISKLICVIEIALSILCFATAEYADGYDVAKYGYELNDVKYSIVHEKCNDLFDKYSVILRKIKEENHVVEEDIIRITYEFFGEYKQILDYYSKRKKGKCIDELYYILPKKLIGNNSETYEQLKLF